MRILKHLKSDWFRYGFETLAVVVGILVAFALDNWNESRKQDKLEIQYLKGLSTDLTNDTVYYNRRIMDSERSVKRDGETIRQMYQIQKTLEDVKFLLSQSAWNSEQLTTQNSTYIELINSGALRIISNRALKNLIIDYYRSNEEAAAHINEFNEVSTRHLVEVGNVIRNYGKLRLHNNDLYDSNSMFFKGEWDFVNDPVSNKFQSLEYALTVYRLKHNVFLDHFRALKKKSSLLISEIQKELDSRTL